MPDSAPAEAQRRGFCQFVPGIGTVLALLGPAATGLLSAGRVRGSVAGRLVRQLEGQVLDIDVD